MTAKTRFSWSSQCWRARHDDFKMFSDKFYDESLGLAVIAYRLWSALLVGDRGGLKRSLGRNCWFARDVKAAMLVITGIKVFFSSGNLTPFPCKFFITWFVVLITNIRHFRKYHNYILFSPPHPSPSTPPPPPPPQKKCITIVVIFSWGDSKSKEKLKLTMVEQILFRGVGQQDNYGIF